ncbi:hypothetical protein ACROYT_G029814 [Oculina patagonica]
MTGHQTRDFVDNTWEVVKLYRRNRNYTLRHEATVFRKPNGVIEVNGASLLSNERREIPRVSSRERRRFYRKVGIWTSSYNVVEFERHGTRDYRMITPGYVFGEVNWV